MMEATKNQQRPDAVAVKIAQISQRDVTGGTRVLDRLHPWPPAVLVVRNAPGGLG